jgi:hypothetical protein
VVPALPMDVPPDDPPAPPASPIAGAGKQAPFEQL